MQSLQPNYHTIADFRKPHPIPLQFLLRLYVQFPGDAGLPGKTTIGIDGSKFKATNRRKNYYNQKKIEKHQLFMIQKQLNNTDNKQISNTDPHSRSIIIVKNILEGKGALLILLWISGF